MRGGERKGAGRPKGEGTQVMRVPLSLVKKVEKLIKEHKHLLK